MKQNDRFEHMTCPKCEQYEARCEAQILDSTPLNLDRGDMADFRGG